ncbi:LacI family DNA-binding transcriptional regulator [Dethiothermospora halolimnae]|uniref:LacI family DNA-binding transcriptional regulator n=1 Tax=Dethiothermospora halolimnae TaxID=3114390 RepID=UPI003CCC3575
MSVTIKDVAKIAGVSISTVSRVINNSKPVSSDVRKRVLEVIDEIGYKPNEVARSLVTKKSFLIGVIVTDIGNSYIAEMVRGIEEVGKMYNYDILLCSTYGDENAEVKYINILKRKQVEGIILISDNDNKNIDDVVDGLDIPFVYLNRYFNPDRYHTVTIDHLYAAYEMTKYLIDLGHNKIGFVTTKDDQDYCIEKKKIEGFKKAIAEYGTVEGKVFFVNNRKISNGYEIAKKISYSEKDLTAIFCGDDNLAIGAISYLYDNRVYIPMDISISGYGDLPIASIFRPRLTTIKEPFYDIGAVAIRKIIKQLNKEKVENNHIKLPFKLLKRDSCNKLD